MDRRKELKLAYKQNPPPMGVYQIKNTINKKIFVGSSMNLQGIFNRFQFQLKMKMHPIKALQEDWDLYGQAAFTFDILETLKSEEMPKDNWANAMAALEEKWLNHLQPYGERGYNKQK